MTRNNHIEIKEVSEVKPESPAARNADGKRKLVDHKIGWAMAVIKTRRKINLNMGIHSLFIHLFWKLAIASYSPSSARETRM